MKEVESKKQKQIYLCVGSDPTALKFELSKHTIGQILMLEHEKECAKLMVKETFCQNGKRRNLIKHIRMFPCAQGREQWSGGASKLY